MTDRTDPADIANPRARLEELEYRTRHGEGPDLWTTLLARLEDPYGPVRSFATGALAERAADELAALARALVEQDTEGVAEATADLGIAADAVPAPATGVRQSACRILAHSNASYVETVLVTAAADEEPDLRYAALVALHDSGADGPDVRVAVEERLGDDDPEVTVVAAQFAAERGWLDLAADVEAAWHRVSGSNRLQIGLALAELAGGEALARETADELTDELVAALDDEETVAAACRGLVALGADRAREPLRRLLDRWFIHPLLRCEAAAALVELGDSRGNDYLADALDHRRKDVRGYAVRIVGRLRLEEFADHLDALARSTDYHADTALLALGEWAGEAARETLAKVHDHHDDPDLSRLAERILAHLDATGSFDADTFELFGAVV
ncbi:MAG: HEAT repeat domain-containing protein [Bradymonadaceae bacterium]